MAWLRSLSASSGSCSLHVHVSLSLTYIQCTSSSGEDYNLTTVYTFTPDDTEIIVPITIFDDVVVEGDEVLMLSLSTGLPSSIVSLNPGSASVTIRDNDGNENTCIHCSVSRESLYSGRGSRHFVLNHYIYSPYTQPTNSVAIQILVNFNTTHSVASAQVLKVYIC